MGIFDGVFFCGEMSEPGVEFEVLLGEFDSDVSDGSTEIEGGLYDLELSEVFGVSVEQTAQNDGIGFGEANGKSGRSRLSAPGSA